MKSCYTFVKKLNITPTRYICGLPYVFLIFIGINFYFLLPQNVYAAEPLSTLIINQIRGNESCCEKGDPQMISILNSDSRINHLPQGWAIRYDVFNDETVAKINTLPKQSLGILLEITPSLASASGVIYKGAADGKDWHDGRNSLLIGYTQSERRHLIDTVFAAFYEQFQMYPSFTAGWMIDSWSLEYIHNTYGVKLHEITKEQYETDDYTLYGGVFNEPYYASNLHPLIPVDDQSHILMLRQTVSDIEKNYGSYQSFYTSQPNDYLSQKQNDSSYFEYLLNQAGSQTGTNKFALLGLENTKEWSQYKDEFTKQLIFISDQADEGKIQVLSLQEYIELYKKNQSSKKLHFLKSPQFPEIGVLWFFGDTYRALLERRGEKLVLSDFRVYSELSDPYREESAKTNRAYWVIPYLIDSSQQYTVLSNSNDLYKGNSIRRDSGVERFGLELSSNPLTKLEIQENSLKIYNNETELVLTPQKISIKTPSSIRFLLPLSLSLKDILDANTDEYYTFNRHPRFVIKVDRENQQLLMGWENPQLQPIFMATASYRENQWQLIPNTRLTQPEINSLSAIFQPDRTSYPFDKQKSTFYWPKTEAIADKNPVRLYIDPRNILGRPVVAKNLKISSSTPEVQIQLSQDTDVTMKEFFVDFTASHSAQASVTVSVGGNLVQSQTIIFFTDCKRHVLECATDWPQLRGYVSVLLSEKYQMGISQLKQWKQFILIKLNEWIGQLVQWKF